MKITNREMYLIIILITIIASSALWLYIDIKQPLYKNQSIQIENIKEKINRDKRYISMHDHWLDELNELQENLKIFDISEKSVSPQLMQIIKNISIETGINIIKNQPYDEKPTGDLFEIGINCAWNGNLNSIINFLTRLQQNGIQYDIRTLNITPDGKGTGRLKGNMIIHCAYIKK